MIVATDLLNEKKLRTAKTIRREEVDKPPFMFIADGYTPLYLGIDKKDVTSIEQAVEITAKVSDDLQFDTSLMLFMPANVIYNDYERILGGACHSVIDASKQINPEAVVIMEPDEYPELAKDPMKFMMDTLLPRRLSYLRDQSFEEKTNTLLQYVNEINKLEQLDRGCAEAGVPVMMGAGVVFSPVDYIFDFMRDFVGISGDIKRRPEQVNEAATAMLETIKPLLNMYPPAEEKAIFMPMHIPAFLRPKDFEKAYWPTYKKIMEYFTSQGRNVVCYFEKKYQHLFDYLQELPKQGVIGVFQEDDMRLTKEKLGDTMAMAGWLSTEKMRLGTKEQCIDHVKELIDVMCPGGGYFIAPDTPMMFETDGKPENVKAVADYIKDYRF